MIKQIGIPVALASSTLFSACKKATLPPTPTPDSMPTAEAGADELSTTHLPLSREIRLETECPGYLKWKDLGKHITVISPQFMEETIADQKSSKRTAYTGEIDENVVLTERLAKAMLTSSCYHYERMRVLQRMMARWPGRIQDDTGEVDTLQLSFRELERLLDDPDFVDLIHDTYPNSEIDCVERCAIFASDFMLRYMLDGNSLEPLQIQIWSGMTFEPGTTPRGGGHSWLVINGEIIDPSIIPDGNLRRLPLENSGYVAMIGTVINLDPANKKVSNFYATTLQLEAKD